MIKIKLCNGGVLFYPKVRWGSNRMVEVGYNKTYQVPLRKELHRQWPFFWRKKEVVVQEARTFTKFVVQGWVKVDKFEYAIEDGTGVVVVPPNTGGAS